MRAAIKYLRSFGNLDPRILNLIKAEFCLQLVNAAFFLILNIYMSKLGYNDAQIAEIIAYRFMAVLAFAFPFGVFIKGRRLFPVFLTVAIALPILSIISLTALPAQNLALIKALFLFWGITFSCLHITILPYLLRNVEVKNHTKAISLHFTSWSSSTIVSGIAIFGLKRLIPDFFDERALLYLFCGISFLAIFFILRMGKEEIVTEDKADWANLLSGYDWAPILKAIFPTMMIAIGAGFTIPFINLFFFHTFGVDSDQFAIMGSVTAILVMIGSLLVPKIKERFGYNAITWTQSLSVLALTIMACTDFLSEYSFAIYLAVFCYIIRQPLMNLAGPMTSELTMYYVGKKNQEIVSAITSSIWAGSWFISSKIFAVLRSQNYEYGEIFFITSVMYVFGIVLYYLLIKSYQKKQLAV